MFNPSFFPKLSSLVILLAAFVVTGHAQPQISSVSPTSGYTGTAVTITGSGFSPLPADNIVYFGAVRASVSSATATSLTVSAPVGATYEPISVTTNGLTTYSAFIFNITLPQPGLFTPATLAPRINIPLGVAQDKVRIADFNNDGKPDVAFYYQLSSGITVCANISTLASIMFSAPTSFSSAYSPSEMSIADLDGDGLKDIILSYTGSSFISVLKNIAVGNTINFAPAVNLVIPAGGWGVTTTDMDKDGKPDIVYTTNASIGALKNTSSVGTISFAAAVQIAALSGANKIICADLDSDGKQDVIIANPGANNISLFQNTSTDAAISLSAGINYTTGANPRDVAAGDIDGDGKTDIVVANNNSNSLSVLRNTSSGAVISMAAKIDFSTGINPTSVAINDLNGDGKADIATGNSNASTISLLQNNSGPGNIALSAKRDFAGGQLGISVAAADMDGDGKTDIVGGNLGSNSFSVLLSKVNEPYISSFTPTTGTSGTLVTIRGLNFTNASAVAFGGVNAASFSVVSDTVITAVPATGATGIVAVTNMYGTGSLTGFVYDESSILPPFISSFSPGSGAIGSQVSISGSHFDPSISGNIVRFGSVQANVISASEGNINVTVPAGSTFMPLTVTTNYLTGYASRGFNVTFPGGGIPFTQSSFLSPLTYNNNPSENFFSISDLDGDGKPDAVSAFPGSADVQVKKNTTNGTGTLSFSTQFFPSSGQVNDVLTEDFNGDGKVDIAAAHLIAGSVSVLQNTSSSGNLSFTSTSDYLVAAPGGMSAGDLNNDGKPELLVLYSDYSYTNDRVRILRNTSTGSAISFAPAVNFETGSYPGNYNGSANASAIADFNGDNLPDIVVALSYSPGLISISKNTSTNNLLSFATPVYFTTANWPRQIAVGDIDGDGKADLAVVSSTDKVVSLFRNLSDYSTGIISFASRVDIPFTGTNAFGVAIGDIDGDGKADIVASQQFSPSAIILFRNISTAGTFSFASGVNFALNDNLASRLAIVDFNGDGKPDVASSGKILVNNITAVVVPVKLLSLAAQEQAGKVKLAWKTANEQNADRFQVEYSTDGNSFTAIGAVMAFNMISGGSYSFIHTNPSQGINYYRLKMLDKDGRFSYSYVVRATLSGQSNQEFTVYPTTAKDFIIAEHPASEMASIKIITMAGAELRTIAVKRNELQTRVSLEGLAAGVYVATWTNGTKTMSCRFIVQ
jgi:large repetitive protein